MTKLARDGAAAAATCILWLGGAALADTSHLDTSASTVHLRKDCGTTPNCLEDDDQVATDGLPELLGWIWASRNPTSSDPLEVEIGPGDFAGTISCSLEGNVTFRGAGRRTTRIVAEASGGLSLGVAAVVCPGLGFHDLGIVATDGTSGYGVYWLGGGDSTWEDVEIQARTGAWLDFSCGGASTALPSGTHRLHGARLVSRVVGIQSECGDVRLFDGEVVVEPQPGDAASDAGFVGVWSLHRARTQLVGSTVEVTARLLASSPDDLFAARVGPSHGGGPAAGYGELHAYDTHLQVDTSIISGIDATGIDVDPGGAGDARAFANGSSVDVRAGSGGAATRVDAPGHDAVAHVEWLTAGPVAPAGATLTGMALFVENDCDATGDCDTAGDVPRLMIHRTECGTANPWWDAAAGACR